MRGSPLAAVLVAAGVFTFATNCAEAAPPARAVAARVALRADDPKADQPKNAGTITGRVATISYPASTMTVVAGSRHVTVHVLPSTQIQGPGNAFHTIADIKKGAHVRVLLSQTGSTYNAQLITLL